MIYVAKNIQIILRKFLTLTINEIFLSKTDFTIRICPFKNVSTNVRTRTVVFNSTQFNNLNYLYQVRNQIYSLLLFHYHHDFSLYNLLQL